MPDNQGLNEEQAAAQEKEAASKEQPSGTYEELKGKKGFKDDDSFAKSYTEMESVHGKTQNAFNKVKEQIETQSQGQATLNEKGEVVKRDGTPFEPTTPTTPTYPAASTTPTAPAEGEEVYDEYTGRYVTDPIEKQLIKFPPYQRQAMIANAVYEQNEKMRQQSFGHEQAVINSPEAKGFEDDLRKVMNQLPIAQRANKKEWERGLLQVKGARYDQDKQNWGQKGVDQFINTQGAQGTEGAGGGGGGGVKLTDEQEKIYKVYETDRPGMFKDRAHFLKSLQKDGGR